MKTLKAVNVAIVGGGWTGLAMAKEITGRTSLSVLILERVAADGLCLAKARQPECGGHGHRTRRGAEAGYRGRACRACRRARPSTWCGCAAARAA